MVKQKILNIIKEGRKSTAEISARINRNYYDTINFLKELKEENKVTEIKENKYVYWECLNKKLMDEKITESK